MNKNAVYINMVHEFGPRFSVKKIELDINLYPYS